MDFKSSKSRSARAGFSLPEMLISTALGLVLMTFAGTFYLFSMRSFTSLANYSDLNMKSRSASDLISRDLRAARSVLSTNSNTISLNEADGVTTVTYTYSPSGGTLTRDDGSRRQVVLTQIVSNSFAFSFYGRPTTNAYEAFPTKPANAAKLVGCKWSCTRPVMAGSPKNSESVEMALVNLRNQ
jgi:prepilin-type N-terminal cleavage/methylation domain-containing protein